MLWATLLTLAVLLIGGAVGSFNALRLDENRRVVSHTHEVVESLETLLSTLKDAETGQRGYLLSADERFLAPYQSALNSLTAIRQHLSGLVADNPEQAVRLRALGSKIDLKLGELKQTIDLLRAGDQRAAVAMVTGGRGKAVMDDLRRDVAEMQAVETALLDSRERETDASYRATVASIVVATIVGIMLIGVVSYLFQRNLSREQRAARRLAEEKERLRTTLASIGDAVISTDPAGDVVYLNPVAESLTGWTNEQAAGLPLSQVFNIVNESTRLPVENPAKRALKDGVIVGLANHTVLIARDGSERPIDDSAAPVRGADDTVTGSVLVFRDITARRRAERQLREQDEQFRRTLSEVAIPTLLHADDDQILLVNKAWTEGSGYQHEDIPTINDWTARAYGEHHTVAEDYIDTLFQSDVRVDNGEWEITTASGEKRLWHFFATPVGQDSSGRRLIVSNAIDVTEQRRAEHALRESEARLRMAQRVSRIGTFEWNIKTGANMWTPDLEAMYGLPPGGFAGTQKTWEELVHPDDRQQAMRAVGEALANGDFDAEWRVVWPDGSVHWIAGRASVFKDDDGTPQRLLGVNIDITERKRDEEELRRLAAELSEADRRKDEFLATLAHELRNPLAPIRTGLQILQRSQRDGADVDQVRDMMARQTDQLVRLVDDLMDVSRITRGSLELRKDRVELETVLHMAVETARPIIESGGHQLTVTLPPTPVFVEADMTRLGQVFANLLNNAAKYSEPGGHIRVTVERRDGDLLIRIKDNGIGIPPHMLPTIFDMFAQVDRTLERTQGGLGIGLTLAQRLAVMHGGALEAYSDGLGHGSEFVVRLPAALAVVPDGAALESNDTRYSPVARRVLVADDNEDSVRMMAMLLGGLGHDVRTAANGLQAVREADEFEPDVVILDIGMPRLNGYEACRRIRALPGLENAVMIALSGWGQEEDKRRSEEAGFHYHVVKPVDPSALMQLLSQLKPPTT
jgi:PAS domain S-box-containing protein